MDVTYRSAAFTIVAARGDNGEAGLSGASTVAEAAQPQVDIELETFVSTLPGPIKLLRNQNTTPEHGHIRNGSSHPIG
jgi:putative aminopeptidase FrvX